MVLAKKLQKWDTIWIAVPSWPCTEEKYREVQRFIVFLESLWFFVKLADNFLKHDIFMTSGWTPEERAEDFNKMIIDRNIKVIWCLQWWNTINQILDLIDYESLKSYPKIIIWKSDIDVLHNAIFSKIWLITFHWPDSKIGKKWEMELEYSQKCFIERLVEIWTEIHMSQTRDRYELCAWEAHGRMIWCNLTSILKLAWTEYFPDFSKDFILCMETYKDNPKDLLPKLSQLEMLWVFKMCTWLIIWSNFAFDETYWKAEEVIMTFFKNYDFL